MAPRLLSALLCLAATADASSALTRPRPAVTPLRQPGAELAMVMPGESLAEVILVDGSLNFLSIYTGILTVRILLSWVPQAQGIEILRPIFTVSDAYLNLFRGVIPPIGGIDISPIGAFFVLNLLTNSLASLGATSPPVAAPTRPVPRPLQQVQGFARDLRQKVQMLR